MNSNYASEEKKTGIFYRIFVISLIAFLLVFAIVFVLIKIIVKKSDRIEENKTGNEEYRKRDFILLVSNRNKRPL